MVSVDCGIASLHEAALCRELGLELIVTDHHAFATPPGPPLARGGSAIPPLGKGGLGGVDSGENVRTPPLVRGGSAGPRLPEATVLVHPRLPGSEYPFGELCGAGVALKLAWSICRRLGDGRKASPAMREFLMGAVGLAALGTVADVVPLCGENRILVRYGLSSLLERPSTGLKALLNVAGLGDRRCLEAEHIGFALAPRINAAGRLGQARLAVELLTTGDPERAEALAKYLDELNGKRKTVERRIFKRARQLVDEHPDWEHAPALVLADADWHPGVIGIVASRIAEHYGRPALLLAVDAESGLAQGSGRTFAGFDLHAALAGCGGLLVSFGGHQAAAGLKLAADRVDEFREEFCRVVAARHTAASRDLEIRIDAEVRLADVHRHAVVELDRLGPFGCENPKPVFAATNVELVEPPRRMGEGEHHLSLRVRQYGTVLRAIAFGRGEWADEIAKCGGPLSIGFTAGLNTYKGFERVELQLEDWNAAGA
ncbi:MAG: single-stranded-DNA-specific exonuclease RecJ [Planctomycetes bacterium]|nr:single-stranded-DNA-specific exonuclease RecJ [Planctomycetota bacterium]